MTELRCPMCGKPNPYHLDVCKFCQARLRPLIASPDSSATPKSSDESKSGLPDWMSSMRGDAADELGGEDDFFDDESGDDATDWLSRIQDEPVSRVDQPPETRPGEAFEADLESTGGEDEWLQRIRKLQKEDQDVSESLEVQPEDERASPFTSDLVVDSDKLNSDQDGIPDWLESFHEETEKEPDTPASAEGLPDWLSEMGALPTSGPEDGAEIPNWLADFREVEAGEPEPALAAEIPDWLSDRGGDEPVPSEEPEAGTPDWLADLGAVETESPEPGLETEIPDWLSGLEAADETVLSDQPQADAETPDWLSEVEAVEDEIPGPPAQAEVPAWISDLGSAKSPSEDQPAIHIESPDWLSDLEKDEGPSAVGDENLPDWLSDLGSDEVPLGEAEAEISLEGDDLPDWLSGIDDDIAETKTISSLESGDEMPGWLKQLGTVVTGSVEDEPGAGIEPKPVSPFVSDESTEGLLDINALPDWLSDERPSRAEDESDLAPAELPGWLAAMRPVVSAAPGVLPEEDNKVEAAGPLAGLRGVLSAEPEVANFIKKPASYTLKLSAPENQQAQAALLDKLIATEGDTSVIQPPSLVSSQRIFRWLIALVLFVVMGIVLIGGQQNVPLPIQPAILQTSRTINALPDQAPVLLAFDYEPGMAGEMNAAAAALVDHLMLQGARLTLVSTKPTGPATAEYFIRNVQRKHDYNSGLQYINLGYIPGGPTGLQSLAQRINLVFSRSYDGMDPWGTQPLQGIETLADYGLVVIITDDSDVARHWIEQVQPALDNTPLIMVVSAQAEPMVRPYFNESSSAPVQGLISGLMGGAAYEVVAGRENLGRAYWDAFNTGLMIAIAIILVGGFTNLIMLLLARVKEARGEAQ